MCMVEDRPGADRQSHFRHAVVQKLDPKAKHCVLLLPTQARVFQVAQNAGDLLPECADAFRLPQHPRVSILNSKRGKG